MMQRAVSVAVVVAAGVLGASRAAAECPPTELAAHLDAAEAAYVALDADVFASELGAASDSLSCLESPIPPSLAAHYHRLEALRVYAIPDEEAARHALRAARADDPGYAFGDRMLPRDHTLRQQYEAMPTTLGPTAPVPAPENGEALFDGQALAGRPADRAAIFQIVEGDRALQTAYVYPEERLPKYAIRGNAARKSPVLPILISVGGASLALSGLTYGLAWGTHKPFFDTSDTEIDKAGLEALQRKSKVLSGLSGAFLVVGVGAGVGGAVVATR